MSLSLRTTSMTVPLRLALVTITLALLLTSLVRGTPQGRMLTAALLGPDLRGVELLGLTVQERRPPATMTERVRADLSAPGASDGAPRLHVPDPDQGVRFVTDTGLRWWGAAPEGAGPWPVVILLHDDGRDGRAMVDMWHEVAMREGLVLVAPDFTGARQEGAEGPYDARIAVEALAQAREIFAVDEGRVGLFGAGAGAAAVQIWANRIDGPWDAVAAHGATVPVEEVQPVARGVPVRLYLGDAHPGEPVGQALARGTAMARAGHPFELIRMRGHDDWFYGVGERVAEDAWRWMSDQLGPQPRR
jgi:dienelactone hydrolase